MKAQRTIWVVTICLFQVGFWLWGVSVSQGAELLKVSTPIRESPVDYLPLVAAEEKGFWKQNGLDGKWTPFNNARLMYDAVMTGDIPMGTNMAASVIETIARRVPIVIASNLQLEDVFYIWATVRSGIKEVKELKGGRVGIPRIGGLGSSYVRMVAKSLGMEKEVRLVGLGSIPALLAGLKTGAVEATVEPTHLMIKLKLDGTVTEIARLADYHPKEWLSHVVFARRDFVESKKEAARRAVKSLVEAARFVQNNRDWALGKMMSMSGFSRQVAERIFSDYRFTADGKIERQAVENLVQFLIEYGLVAKGQLPSIKELYAEELFG